LGEEESTLDSTGTNNVAVDVDAVGSVEMSFYSSSIALTEASEGEWWSECACGGCCVGGSVGGEVGNVHFARMTLVDFLNVRVRVRGFAGCRSFSELGEG